MSSDTTRPASHLPIVCHLSGPEQQRRRLQIASDIYKDLQQVDELPDGYSFRYPDGEEVAARLLEFITFERKCCPFMTFELVFEPDQDHIQLRLRGPEGTREFIKDEMKMLESSDK
jgi:hypothetical protein